MKVKTFSPILAPNEQPNLNELKYPLLVSRKLDGVRCIIYRGQILSRSLKPIPNKQLKEKLESIRKYSEEMNMIFDGEIYSPYLTFQQIISFVMTEDFTDKKSIKKFGKVLEIPEHLKFYCFDLLDSCSEKSFSHRIGQIRSLESMFTNIVKNVEHTLCKNAKEVEDLFEIALKEGCEGLILRDPNGRYKFGRGTLKEGIIYKVKPFVTFDAQITGVVQSTEVNPIADKKINELGYSVTSKKKDDRILINKASAFYVNYEGKELKVVLAMTDEEKEEVWKNRDSYIGRTIEYKGMLIGAKDLPRHPVFVRFREDKD